MTPTILPCIIKLKALLFTFLIICFLSSFESLSQSRTHYLDSTEVAQAIKMGWEIFYTSDQIRIDDFYISKNNLYIVDSQLGGNSVLYRLDSNHLVKHVEMLTKKTYAFKGISSFYDDDQTIVYGHIDYKNYYIYEDFKRVKIKSKMLWDVQLYSNKKPSYISKEFNYGAHRIYYAETFVFPDYDKKFREKGVQTLLVSVNGKTEDTLFNYLDKQNGVFNIEGQSNLNVEKVKGELYVYNDFDSSLYVYNQSMELVIKRSLANLINEHKTYIPYRTLGERLKSNTVFIKDPIADKLYAIFGKHIYELYLSNSQVNTSLISSDEDYRISGIFDGYLYSVVNQPFSFEKKPNILYRKKIKSKEEINIR